MHNGFSVSMVLILISGLLVQGSSPKPEQLSVLYVLADDLGSVDASYGARLHGVSPPISTPNIDALAMSPHAVVLTNYYTHIICGPSRSALLTGRTSFSLGNPFAMIGPKGGGGLPPQYNTIADEFLDRGYATALVGKWGVDFAPFNDTARRGSSESVNGLGVTGGLTPTERGFQSFYGLYSSAHNYYTKEFLFTGAIDWHVHNATHKLDYPDVDPEPNVHSTALFTREAIKIIKTWSPASPGFLELSFAAPHDPLQPDPAHIAPGTPCGNIRNRRRRFYCGLVAGVDEAVGQVVQALKDQNMLEHTIIVFHSDNGGSPGVGGFNYPLRGQKATPYQGGVLNPGFIFAPKLFRGDVSATSIGMNTYPQLMAIADMAPTLLSLIDRSVGRAPSVAILEQADAGGPIDGVDHAGSLLYSFGLNQNTDNNVAPPPPRTDLVIEYNILMDHAAFISGPYKLMLGRQLRGERFLEPKGFWYDSEARLPWVLEETACEVFDLQFGPNWFALCLAVHFEIDSIREFVSGNKRYDITTRLLHGYEVGDVMQITHDKLPVPMWDMYEHDYVQLYNLEQDPQEDHNIALNNKELVANLTTQLHAQILARGKPHQLSVQKQVDAYMAIVARLLRLIAVASVAWWSVMLYCFYRIWKFFTNRGHRNNNRKTTMVKGVKEHHLYYGDHGTKQKLS
eukprot:c12689_g1_i2.p1 GENE.c12689_g1_i2~~c12689_g1_i2.p1  ORF type:complete len:682 (-),score=147.68 c12689_g1_i2:272-2317(-)